MKKVILHTLSGSRSAELLALLKEHTEEVFVTGSEFGSNCAIATDLAAEDQESLIVAFPDTQSGSSQEMINKVLTSTFGVVQKFVSTRMKKRFGQILFLVDARANGLAYSEEGNTKFLAAQGGFVGLSKTTSKEYSKRGIISNVLYIDWQSVSLREIVERAKSLLEGNSSLKGQVFALDGGRWL